jgi:hypothetical protein
MISTAGKTTTMMVLVLKVHPPFPSLLPSTDTDIVNKYRVQRRRPRTTPPRHDRGSRNPTRSSESSNGQTDPRHFVALLLRRREERGVHIEYVYGETEGAAKGE